MSEIRLVASLAAGRNELLNRLFAAKRARPPLLIWSPSRLELLLPGMERLFDAFSAIDRCGGLPLAAGFDQNRLGRLGDWMMIVECEDDGDYTYSHYGEGVAGQYGRNLTGHRLSGYPPHIARFFAGLYKASALRRESFLCEYEAPESVFVGSWRAFGVPLADAAGGVIRFAVFIHANTPLRDVADCVRLPVVVADFRREVRHLNPTALRFFGIDEPPGDVDSLLGPGLALPGAPADLLPGGKTGGQQRVYHRLPDGRAVEVGISASRLNATCFFVLTVKALGRDD